MHTLNLDINYSADQGVEPRPCW